MNNLLLPSSSLLLDFLFEKGVSQSLSYCTTPGDPIHTEAFHVTSFDKATEAAQYAPSGFYLAERVTVFCEIELCCVFLAGKPSDGCQLQCFLHSPACTLQQQSCRSLKSPTSLKSKLHLCFYSNNPITCTSIHSSSCSNSTLWMETICSS